MLGDAGTKGGTTEDGYCVRSHLAGRRRAPAGRMSAPSVLRILTSLIAPEARPAPEAIRVALGAGDAWSWPPRSRELSVGNLTSDL